MLVKVDRNIYGIVNCDNFYYLKKIDIFKKKNSCVY